MPTIIGNSEGRQGSVSIVRNSGRNTVRNKFHYDVLADSATQTRDQIVQAPGLPTVGSTIDPIYGLCIGLNAVRDVAKATLWHLEFEYSTEAAEGGQQVGDPTAWIPQAEIQFEVFDEYCRRDRTSPTPKLFVNSAHSPFETGIAIPKTVLRRDFFQFEPASTAIATFEDRNNTVNSATFLGRAAKSFLLQIRSAKIGTYYGTRCWLVDYSMKFNSDTWTLRMLDVGYSYLDSGNRKPYYDDDGQTIILGGLNGSGAKVATQSTDPAELTFERYSEIDFSTFIRLTA